MRFGVVIGAAVLAAAVPFCGLALADDVMRPSLASESENPLALTAGEAAEILYGAASNAAKHRSVPAALLAAGTYIAPPPGAAYQTAPVDPAAPAAAPGAAPAPAGTVDLSDPATRMLASLPDEVEPYFDLYLYVSKAEAGPIAQHMFVYSRAADGTMSLLYDWPVSTGREKKEKTPSGRKTFTHTPEGSFKLDPKRFHTLWKSRAWNADMPWTMFFDLVENGGMSGLAIHAAGKGKISQLGRRASGGCIRLAPENAQFLFKKIQAEHAGFVPVFAMAGDSTNVMGEPARNADGSLQLTHGYRVLLHIEDYAGEHVPALSVASAAPAVVPANYSTR
ncbi:MAG: L,D-transpeptidase [Micropepsaceae bacterium]